MCRNHFAASTSCSASLLLLAGTSFAQETTRASVTSTGAQAAGYSAGAAVSADGRFVAFISYAADLVVNDTNGYVDVFRHDRQTGVTIRVSVGRRGGNPNWESGYPELSGDGRFVAFSSIASDLIDGDTNQDSDVFVRDVIAGTTERISVDVNGAEADGTSGYPAISRDGNLVAFVSNAALVPEDQNGRNDIYLRDRAAGTLRLVSTNSNGVPGTQDSYTPSLSADGTRVAFTSYADNLVHGDHNGVADVFVKVLATDKTIRASVGARGGGNADSYGPKLSQDGMLVVFSSDADDLVAGDDNHGDDVFLRDLGTQTTVRLSELADGTDFDGISEYPELTPDGRFVVFQTHATNVAGGNPAATAIIVLLDRMRGLFRRLSIDSTGVAANAVSWGPEITDDGTVVVFSSNGDNLVPLDTNASADVFVHSRDNAVAAQTNYGASFPGTFGAPLLTASADPVLGTTIEVTATDSAGIWTLGFLLTGTSPASLPTTLGGTLLVDVALFLPVPVPPAGWATSAFLPYDAAFSGVSLFLQVLEMDAGAAKGVSFSDGLELALGF